METIEFAVSKTSEGNAGDYKMSLRQFHDDSAILSDISPNNRLVWGDHIPVPSSRKQSFRARPCKMAVAAGCFMIGQPGGRAGRAWDTGAAGSLVLRRMDRRGHKRGLVRAKKHGTKSGSGRRAAGAFLRGGRSDYMLMYMTAPTAT